MNTIQKNWNREAHTQPGMILDVFVLNGLSITKELELNAHRRKAWLS